MLSRPRIAALALLAVVAGLVPLTARAATVDGLYDGIGSLRDGIPMELIVTGRGGVPATGAGSVVLNITATAATEDTYLTVWPAGEPRPWASNLNVADGQTVANLVVSKIGAGGKVAIANSSGRVHVAVDVMGWFPDTAPFTGVTPTRLLDTRPNGATVDGQQVGNVRIPARGTRTLPVTGRGGVPSNGVDAVVLNVTALDTTRPTYVTVWPAGAPRPLASNLNLTPGRAVPNLVIAKIGTDGAVSLYVEGGATNVIVDLLGWFPTASTYESLVPARLADTRSGYQTIDGLAAGGGRVGPQETLELVVGGRGGVPGDGVEAVALNVTVTNPAEPSFLTVWPTGEPAPWASNLNMVQNLEIANMVIAKVGAGGKVSIRNEAGSTDVVVDVMGWFPTGGDERGLSPQRLADTRPADRTGTSGARPVLHFAPGLGPGTLEVLWPATGTAPWNTFGAPVVAYEIEVSPAPTGGTILVPGGSASSRITGLTDGVAYRVRARARAADRWWGPWSPVSNPEVPSSVPAAPAAPTATGVTPAGSGQVELRWTAPAANGAPITGYTIVVVKDGAESRRSAAEVDPAATELSQVVRVPLGHDYRFSVLATNRAGDGIPSPLSTTLRV